MTTAGEIERALEALWRGKTGGTLQAIRRQAVLIGLEFVISRARSESATDVPTAEQVAAACRKSIADACEEYTEIDHDPEFARVLLGVAQGSGGTTRAVRRQRIMDRYDLSYNLLTHTRRSSDDPTHSTSPETRAIEAVAGELARREQAHHGRATVEAELATQGLRDFISPLLDPAVRCCSYSVEVIDEPGDPQVTISREYELLAARDGTRRIAVGDAWEVVENKLLAACDSDEELLERVSTTDDHGTTVHLVDLGADMERDKPTRLLVFGRYGKHPWEPEGPPLPTTLGFYVPPRPPVPRLRFLAVFPKGTRAVVTRATQTGSMSHLVSERKVEPWPPDHPAIEETGAARFGLEDVDTGEMDWFEVVIDSPVPGATYWLDWHAIGEKT